MSECLVTRLSILISCVTGILAGMFGHVGVWGWQFGSISDVLPHATTVEDLCIVRGLVDSSGRLEGEAVIVFAEPEYDLFLEQGWGSELALFQTLHPWFKNNLISAVHRGGNAEELQALLDSFAGKISKVNGGGRFSGVVATVRVGDSRTLWARGEFTPPIPEDDDLLRWQMSQQGHHSSFEACYVSRLDLHYGPGLFLCIAGPVSLITFGLLILLRKLRRPYHRGFEPVYPSPKC